jgi:hypothetical protein
VNRVPESSHAGDIQSRVQRDAFRYFERSVNPGNGLVADNTRPESKASIAAVGFALSCYAVGVERGFMPRAEAADRTLAALRFFRDSPQGEAPDTSGYRGFYYHFLDMQSGRRAWKSEISLVDTAILIAGMLTAGQYFDADSESEAEIRDLAEMLYARADWKWALNDEPTIRHGWKPECGFLHYGWEGYSEAILLYVLALGSPTFSLAEDHYRAWTSTYQWENLYGWDLLYAGPLFIHQFSHAWIDFRGIRDAFMREKRSDYFENSRRAVHLQWDYARQNPRGFRGYGPRCWGITACDGPEPGTGRFDGREQRFLGYAARGVPYGPDDGTLAPAAAAASLPFAPEIVLPTLEHLYETVPEAATELGFRCFNPTLQDERSGRRGWTSGASFAVDQGPVVLMIENHRSGFLWELLRRNRYFAHGLRRAGFRGGWL